MNQLIAIKKKKDIHLPQFLTTLDNEVNHYYGTLKYDEHKNQWLISGEPIVAQMAKRLFPGSTGKGRGIASFPNTKRNLGDLNWLMLRYPLKIEDQERWLEVYNQTVEHVLKREEINLRPLAAVPPPIFKGKLKDYQQTALGFMMQNKRVLLADDVGLGKTVSSLALVCATYSFPALVVVQPHLYTQWKSEVEKFLAPDPKIFPAQNSLFPEAAPLVHLIKGLSPYELPPAAVYIIHYGLLRGWKNVLPELFRKIVIYDEVQELRHTGTEKYSAASLLSEACEYCIGLSATPIHNCGAEIWNVLNIIDYHCLGDKDSFTREWCYGYGSETVAEPEILGDLLRREGLMLRRLRKDTGSELPPVNEIIHNIDVEQGKFDMLIRKAALMAKKYEEVREWAERGRLKREIENAARQATGIAKAPYVASFVESLLEAKQKVLVYAWHHSVFDIFEEKLKKFSPGVVNGRVTPAEKNAAIESFKKGETDVLLISLRASAGLNLPEANCVVFAELEWAPAWHTQGIGRTQRDEQAYSVMVYYMVTENGSDPAMMEALGLKVAQFEGLFGGKGNTQKDQMLAQEAAAKHMDMIIERLQAIA